MRKSLVLIITIACVGALIIFFRSNNRSENSEYFIYEVSPGSFESKVVTSGEIQTVNSEFITLPKELYSGNVRIYDIKITNLIEEGTQVDSGDFVASLDHAVVINEINSKQTTLEERIVSLEDARMDTSLLLNNLRNEILNSTDNLEEKKIIVEQSIYESPAVQRQTQMDLERAERALNQLLGNYELQKRKAEQRISSIKSEINLINRDINELENVFNSLNIVAPKSGMVIYLRDRMGEKMKVGSMVSRWSPEIAQLPDFSELLSRTYINEVDISKIKIGQKVKVGIDAFPDKIFDGEVSTVSNIGQNVPRKNTKVFEVDILISGSDSLLKPSMTTKNTIETARFDSVLFIPIDAVYTEDSIKYVFTINDIRKEIYPGISNENFVVIDSGLNVGDKIYLNPPSSSSEWDLIGLDGKIKKTEP